jgi:Fe(3+) dicitrate transport protein
MGFRPSGAEIKVGATLVEVELQLHPAGLAQEVLVSGRQIIGETADLERLPGSVGIVPASVLKQSRVFTTDEALRKISGVHARGEEGFGLRPNIGVRGLNPTRSSRVLLLEDGLPLSYAPYGDNASYYHPPVERFETIEVVKGAGQILYGPMTVGGVINYVTPPAPDRRSGSVSLIGGNRDYFNGHVRYGGTNRSTGWLFDLMRKQGQGSRENVRHGLSDFNARTLSSMANSHNLGIRFNYYREDSNLTYSGLREAEFHVNPRDNPFRNDYFHINRFGAAVTHNWAPSGSMLFTNNSYASIFLRDWWRQSSNSNQRPNRASDPACGGMANLHISCGNEGRLRHYATWGVEPKVRAFHNWFGTAGEADFGIRYHSEFQERYQKNGPLPDSRDGVLVENNERAAQAFSGFFQNRFLLSRLTLIPGIRLEHVRYRRTNFLPGGEGIFGSRQLTQIIPGLGVAYSTRGKLTLFAGAHRGFAPPRVEDVISNATGRSIELEPELSWNYEAGFRSRIRRDFELDAAYFRLDFSNQIIPASVAGGVGATLTNAGRTLHEGGEAGVRWMGRNLLANRGSLSLRAAYTWLPVARFSGIRYSNVPGFANVAISGNRLPYAPRQLLTASAAYSHAAGFQAMIESVYTAGQFGDDLNTRGGTPDGQRGLIPPNTIWNVTLNYPVESWRTTFFVTTKNLLDRLTIVDRTRGILPGIPRLVQFGLRIGF